MELGWLIGLIIGAAMGAALVWLWLRNKTDDVKVEALAEQIKQFDAEAKVFSGKLAVAEEREQHLNKNVEEWRKQATAFMEQMSQSEKQLANLKQQYALKEQAYETLQAAAEKEQKQLLELQKQFKDQFENLSHAILRQQTDQFNTLSKESLGVLINPFKDKLDMFEKTVRESYDTENKERASLKGQIIQLMTLNQQMAEETQNLTQALKGDNKAQGDWGETLLERMFESIGMQEGVHYLVQENIKTEQGSNLRPDFIVKSKNSPDIIIDSKVSLKAYERHMTATDETEKAQALDEHLRSLRQHYTMLASKDYQKHYGTKSFEYIVLFTPIENALTVALRADPTLQAESLKKHVILASTTTLLFMLKMIMMLWRQQNANERADEIVRQAAALYDKFVNFAEDLQGVGVHLDKARGAQLEALNKLSVGKDNLVRKVERLKEFDIPTKKVMPEMLRQKALPGTEQAVDITEATD